MDDLRRLCVRMLGDGPASAAAEAAAREAGGEDRVALLRAGVQAIRPHLREPEAETSAAPAGDGLAAAVAAELRAATRQLSAAQRELLALRELIGLDYAEIAAILDVDGTAVAQGLAQARLELRTALRGANAAAPQCLERDRALDLIPRRQDGMPVAEADEDWLIEHLGICRGCGQAHAAMLEASACYRAWAADDGADDRPVAAATP